MKTRRLIPGLSIVATGIVSFVIAMCLKGIFDARCVVDFDPASCPYGNSVGHYATIVAAFLFVSAASILAGYFTCLAKWYKVEVSLRDQASRCEK